MDAELLSRWQADFTSLFRGATLFAPREQSEELATAYLMALANFERLTREVATAGAADAADTSRLYLLADHLGGVTGPTNREAITQVHELGDLLDEAAAMVKFLMMRPATTGEVPRETIPREHRTAPMNLREAARVFGYRGVNSRNGQKNLRSAMDHGEIRYEQRTRQQFVFDKRQIPESPTRPNSA